MTEEDRNNSSFSGFLGENSKFSIILKYPFLVTKYLAIKFRKSGKRMHRAFSMQSSYRSRKKLTDMRKGTKKE